MRPPPITEAEFERRDEDVTVRGAAAVGVDGEAGSGAEAVRPMDGGAAGFGGEAGLGLGAGLSQDEKKSSSSAAAEVGAAALEVSTPSMTIPFGNLYGALAP